MSRKERIEELEEAVKIHRRARGHDRCWINDFELYEVLRDGDGGDFRLPSKEEFLKACEHYYESNQGKV